ncbi:MAG TPA: type II secretion system minor pseudopilin GspJ [Wenzhouxiangella sp.]
MRPQFKKRTQAGYTLIEILIAIGIFSALSLSAYTALNALSRASAAAEQQSLMLAQLQQTIARLDADVRAVVGRPSFDAVPNASVSDFSGQATSFGAVRSGWANPLDQPRAELQRFQWQFQAGTLQRLYWPTLYPTQRSEVHVESVAVDLEGWSIRYLSPSMGWQTRWPSAPGEAWPQAIEFTLDHTHYGEIRRLIVLN